MLNIYLREQVIKHSKNIKMYSQKIKMSSGFFQRSFWSEQFYNPWGCL